MAVCPRCDFHRETEGVARLELCPRCRAQGTDSYLVSGERPGPRRHDLVGLLAIARAELAAVRAASGHGQSRDLAE